jgi:hypothetical protein
MAAILSEISLQLSTKIAISTILNERCVKDAVFPREGEMVVAPRRLVHRVTCRYKPSDSAGEIVRIAQLESLGFN